MSTSTKTKATVSADVDALTAESDENLTLSSGFVVRVERLKTRGMFKLLKIVTRGAMPMLSSGSLDFDDAEAFVQQLLAVVVMAIPEAEQEAIEFIQSMVVPTEFDENAKTADQKQKNKELFDRLVTELDDPEIDDTISIIERIVANEAADIQALGKRLGSILKTQIKTSAPAEAKN